MFMLINRLYEVFLRILYMLYFIIKLKNMIVGTSLVVQWLRLCTSTAGGAGSTPGWGTKILMLCGAAKKLKNNNNKLKI